MTDTAYADDQALFANTPVQAESLLHSLEEAAMGISLLGKKNKFHVFLTRRSHLHDKPLKLLDCSHTSVLNKLKVDMPLKTKKPQHILAAISHLQKVNSTYTYKRRVLLFTGYRSYGNLISLIK